MVSGGAAAVGLTPPVRRVADFTSVRTMVTVVVPTFSA
jgi:hypothetical protein